MAHRRDRFLELMEHRRLRDGRAAARRELIDLVRQAAHRVLEPDQVLRRRQIAQRVAHLGQPLLQIGQRRRVAAGLPAAADTVGERAHFGFERLHRLARHRILERAADLGEVAAQRGQGVLVGLMQRRDLRVDAAKLLLERRKILSWRRSGPGALRRGAAAIERALARGNLRGPVRAARRRRRGRRGYRGWCRGGLERKALRLDRRAAGFGDDLVEPPVEPRQRFGDAVGAWSSCSRAAPRRLPPCGAARSSCRVRSSRRSLMAARSSPIDSSSSS